MGTDGSPAGAKSTSTSCTSRPRRPMRRRSWGSWNNRRAWQPRDWRSPIWRFPTARRRCFKVSLAVAAGEFVALLGPSGCGKTTLLRAVSGFVPVSGGRISVGGRDITQAPPDKRGMAMVFQSYALWPHMTTAQNLGYGLGCGAWRSRDRQARRRDPRDAQARRFRRAQRHPALRRAAPARGARPRARHQPRAAAR